MTSKETQCSTCSGITNSLQKGKKENANFLKCVDESLSYFEKSDRDNEKMANRLKNMKKSAGDSSYRQKSPKDDGQINNLGATNVGKTELKLMKQQMEKLETKLQESQNIQRNLMNELTHYKQREDETKKVKTNVDSDSFRKYCFAKF